jgi:hypothetical protein
MFSLKRSIQQGALFTLCVSLARGASKNPFGTQASSDYSIGVARALTSSTGLWADQVMAGHGDPTYESLAHFLRPLLYTNAPFKMYPLVLSLPCRIARFRFSLIKQKP